LVHHLTRAAPYRHGVDENQFVFLLRLRQKLAERFFPELDAILCKSRKTKGVDKEEEYSLHVILHFCSSEDKKYLAIPALTLLGREPYTEIIKLNFNKATRLCFYL